MQNEQQCSLWSASRCPQALQRPDSERNLSSSSFSSGTEFGFMSAHFLHVVNLHGVIRMGKVSALLENLACLIGVNGTDVLMKDASEWRYFVPDSKPALY
jgi:hypothetical protein